MGNLESLNQDGRGHKPDATASNSEERIQANCVKWLWNNYPETRGLFILNSNNPLNAIDGMRRKAMGAIPGVADTMFLHNGKVYFLEFKTPKGRQSKVQIEWESLVSQHGFIYVVIRSEEQFRDLIKTWML